MMDTLWQSIVIFFVPLFAYWGSTIDASSIGDLWTIAVVILVNLHLAMDVFQWTRNTHATIWGSLIATWVCVIVIDAVPSLGDLRNCKDQIAGEVEKFGNLRELGAVQIEMNPILDRPQR